MKPSIDCLLIADDLTGACDAAVHFAIRGLRPAAVLVARGTNAGGARVVAVSTESRDLEPAEIRRAVAAVADEFPAGSVARIFKKIDSTLRGNAGVEIATALESFHCDAAIVCPAFPKMHRVVDGGFLRVTSAPDFTPIDVAARLQLQAGEACARMVSVDANCEADLDRIATAILAAGRRTLSVGSAGLASALARLLGQACTPLPAPTEVGAALFCIGSDHDVTLAQQRSLLTERPSTLFQPGAATGESIGDSLAAGKHAILRIPHGQVSVDQVRERIAGAPAAALVLSGGDTASLVCRAVGVQRIELCDEIVTGVPRGMIHGGVFDGFPVATKSGGFGRSDALIQIADYFAGRNR